MFGQVFRCSSRAVDEHRDMVLLWLRNEIGPNPSDSSSTNHLKHANSRSHDNKKKQEVVMMSPRVLSSSPSVDVNHCVLFSMKIRDVLHKTYMPGKSAQSH